MEKGKSRIHGFSLVEMLLVIAILVVFGSMGAGGFLGFRETTLVKENIETLKQDISLAQQKAMLLERNVDDTWIYGIGLDFSEIQNGSYKMFRWCSPFDDFGDPTSTSALPGWEPTSEIGDPITEVLGATDIVIPREQIIFRPPGDVITDPYYPPTDDDPYSCPYTPISYDICLGDYCRCIPGDPCCECRYIYCPPEEEIPQDPITEDPITQDPTLDGLPLLEPIKNGYLPIDKEYSTSCQEGYTTLVEITGEASDKFVDIGNIQLLGTETPIQYLVFEAVTGKAFLYDSNGKPVNYSNMGVFDNTDLEILDIAITRTRSSKFDVLSIYPASGIIVHHTYSNEDLAIEGEDDTITVNGKTYSRYGVFDDIKSYRD